MAAKDLSVAASAIRMAVREWLNWDNLAKRFPC